MVGIIFKPGNRRIVEAYLSGRAHGRAYGLQAARNAIAEAQAQLAATRFQIKCEIADTKREIGAQLRDAHDGIEALRNALRDARARYAMALDIIRRADAIEAMRERCDDGVTLH
jgi:hypothetical protein